MLDSQEEITKEWDECERDDRDSESSQSGPEKERVPLPLPELARECDGTFSGGAKEFVWRKTHGRGVEDAAGQPNERDEENELERIDDVIAQLWRGYVGAEH